LNPLKMKTPDIELSYLLKDEIRSFILGPFQYYVTTIPPP